MILPARIRRLSILEDEAGGDFLAHSIARNLVEAQPVSGTLRTNNNAN
jgi:hypothetical protein